MDARVTDIDARTPIQFLRGLCEESPRGLVILCNILSGLDEKLYDDEFVRQVFNWWHSYLLYRLQISKVSFPLKPNRFEEEALDSLNVLLFGSKDPLFRKDSVKPDFRLSCLHKTSAHMERNVFCTVMRVDHLIKHLMSREDREELVAKRRIYLNVFSDQPDEEEIDAFVLKGERTINLKDKSTLGKKDEVLWVTPASGLRRDMNHITVAERLRDLLGLVGHKEGTSLAMLCLPTNVIASSECARPTFADAGSHERFRTRADRSDHRQQVLWGYTVCLSRLASGKSQIDGRRERVCRPIPSSNIGSVHVLPLGKTLTTRNNKQVGAVDNENFAERLARIHHGKAAVFDRMKKILGLH